MKSYDPDSEYDRAVLKQLGPPVWMIEALAVNPSYSGWAPGDDYMRGPNDKGGWSHAVETTTWSQFDLKPNDLNIVADFYFEIGRHGEDCRPCDGTGYGPRALILKNGRYGPTAVLTEQDRDTLIAAGRDVNNRLLLGMTDCIDQDVLIRAQCEREQAAVRCPQCDGHGYVYDHKTPCHLRFVLWVLHPRKGASRGWIIERIERGELPDVYKFLASCARRNAERFAKAELLKGIS